MIRLLLTSAVALLTLIPPAVAILVVTKDHSPASRIAGYTFVIAVSAIFSLLCAAAAFATYRALAS